MPAPLHMQCYRHRRVWKVSLLACTWKYGKSTCHSTPQDWLVMVKRWKNDYVSFSVLSNILQNVLNTSAITTVTKSSMKPRSSTTTNCHLRSSEERNGEQRLALVEPWCKHWSCSSWWKSTSWDEATLNSEEIKPITLVIIELCLSEGVSQSVSQIVSQ